MRINKLNILVVACCCAMLINSVQAQTRAVKILKLEVDGREIHKGFKILLYVNGKEIEPMRNGNSFIIPPELQSCENVGVRFLWGKYNLFFDSVNISKFNTDWIVGVDKKPFDEENTASAVSVPPGKELLM